MNLSKLETFEAIGLVAVVMINKIILNVSNLIKFQLMNMIK